jgi:pimeloyl-ACP methyl ester carboxylesterase
MSPGKDVPLSEVPKAIRHLAERDTLKEKSSSPFEALGRNENFFLFHFPMRHASCRKPQVVSHTRPVLSERRVRLDGIELNYAEGPDSGPPLVLLHGGSNRWQSWESILPPLAERWHVFAPDLRGHGGSSRTPGDYTIRSFTDDVVAFQDRVVPEPAALFGHSLGAEVAVWAAARGSSRVRAVVVGDGPFLGPETKPMIERQRELLDFQRRYAGSDIEPAELATFMADLPFGRDEHGCLIRARDVLGDQHPEYLAWAESMIALDPSFLDALSDYDRFSVGYGLHLLPDIPCPVLILRAGLDGALTAEDAENAMNLLPDARLVTLEGVGHGIHWQAPDLVLSAVVPFLDEVLHS